MSLKSVSIHINNLRKNKKYQEALNIYKSKIYDRHNINLIRSDPWLIFNIMYCLRKIGKSTSAIEFYDNYLKNKLSTETPNQVKREYGWSLYDIYSSTTNEKTEYKGITNNSTKIEDFIKIISLVDEYLLFTRLLFLLCEIETRKEVSDWEKIAEYMGKYSPEQFSEDTYRVKKNIKGREKIIEIASDRERYYILYSKALFHLERYDECIGICREALEQIERFHFGNNLWFTRRLSVSYNRIGNLDKAIEGFERIIKIKKDWFIQFELANLYFIKKKMNESLVMGCRAAINGGYSEYKVKMFVQLGHIFSASNIGNLPCLHFNLSKTIRDEKGWKIPEELQTCLETFGCSETKKVSVDQYEHLKPQWERYASVKLEIDGVIESTGEISAILHTGSNGDGFINDKDGRGIYFRFPVVKGNKDHIKNGRKVWVKAKKRMHKGKQVWNAIKVKIID